MPITGRATFNYARGTMHSLQLCGPKGCRTIHNIGTFRRENLLNPDVLTILYNAKNTNKNTKNNRNTLALFEAEARKLVAPTPTPQKKAGWTRWIRSKSGYAVRVVVIAFVIFAAYRYGRSSGIRDFVKGFLPQGVQSMLRESTTFQRIDKKGANILAAVRKAPEQWTKMAQMMNNLVQYTNISEFSKSYTSAILFRSPEYVMERIDKWEDPIKFPEIERNAIRAALELRLEKTREQIKTTNAKNSNSLTRLQALGQKLVEFKDLLMDIGHEFPAQTIVTKKL